MYVKGLDASPCGAECERCTLQLEPWVPSFGPDKADIVLVGAAPSIADVKRGRPFTNQTTLANLFEKIGLVQYSFFTTYVMSCTLPERKPSKLEIESCSGRLQLEIAAREPKIIITVGEVATKALIPKVRSLREVVGRIAETPLGKVLPIYDPGVLHKKPGLFRDIESALQYAADLLAGKDPAPKDEITYEVVHSPRRLAEIVSEFPAGVKVSYDVETRSDQSLLCGGISAYPYDKVYVLTDAVTSHPYGREALGRILIECVVIAQNAKFDVSQAWRNNIEAKFDHDTMLVHYAIDERKGTHGLKEMARDFLKVDAWDQVVAPFISHLEDCDPEEVYKYNAFDVAYTGKLFELLYDRMTENERKVYYEYLLPAARTTMGMEYRGVKIDTEFMEELGVKFGAEKEAFYADMKAMVGRDFNPNSNQQLVQIVFHELGVPAPGSYSLDKDARKVLMKYHPFIEKLDGYAKVNKLLGTYVDGFRSRLAPDGTIHGNFNVHGTETGRFSSSGPNLQNIPSRGDKKILKKLFMARPGRVLIEADYSQAELRCLAYYSRDPRLIQMFVEGWDIHTGTAAITFGIPPELVTAYQRQIGKTLNFAVLYGSGPDNVAELAGCSVTEAAEAIRLWFKNFAVAAEWIMEQQKITLAKGYVIMPTGHKRTFPPVTRANRGDIERQAVNTPVQSLAAACTTKALIELDDTFKFYKGTDILLTVHDSIISETAEDVTEVCRVIHRTMVEAAQRIIGKDIPFEVDVKFGPNWHDIEGIDKSMLVSKYAV